MNLFKIITRFRAWLRARVARLTRRSTLSVKITLRVPPFVKVEIGTELPKSAARQSVRRRR